MTYINKERLYTINTLYSTVISVDKEVQFYETCILEMKTEMGNYAVHFMKLLYLLIE